MVIATALVACLAIFADAATTRRGLREGFYEDGWIRRFLIRSFGLNGGTYGVAVVWSAVVVAGNVYSRQPVWGMVAGNLIVVAGFSWAAWRNLNLA